MSSFLDPLPADALVPAMMDALSERRRLVVVAPPGSGKTTRLPAALLGPGPIVADRSRVIVLQPRRIAARAAAARVAEERRWALGETVGYQVRFERRSSSKTRLEFVTEGILTRRLLDDPFLEGVGAVVLDEFHERSLHADLALALLREVAREVRPDLAIVVMSATIDAGPVARFLDDCPVLRAEGRPHDVALEHRPTDHPVRPESLAPVVAEWLERPGARAVADSEADARGHLLVFLPGLAEIRRAAAHLAPLAERAGAVVVPLHGSLSLEEQERALRPSARPKIVLSTNIAETSLTIDGVNTVIDTGLARSARYDPGRGIDRWALGRISLASANQRAGRAGRTGPGRCVRLWSQREERGFAPFDEPEVHRVDLSSTLLALYAWGGAGPERFEWFERPSAERLDAANRLLGLLGALDDGASGVPTGGPSRITTLGRRMLELPVHPRLARLILAASERGQAREGAAVAALLSEKDILTERDTFRSGPGSGSGPPKPTTARGASDVLVRLDQLDEAEAMRFAAGPLRSRGIDARAARQAARLRDELERLARRRGQGTVPRSEAGARGDRFSSLRRHVDMVDDEDRALLEALFLAYPDRLVKRRGAPGTGLMVGGRGARLAPGSVVRDAELYLALDAREDRQRGQREVFVYLASAIGPDWIEALRPELLRRDRACRFDPERQRVVASARLWYLDLLLREDVVPTIEADAAGTLLAEALRPMAETFAREQPRVAGWLDRVAFLREALPDTGWPEFDAPMFEEALVLACMGRFSVAEARQADWLALLQAQLGARQLAELNEAAPVTLALPNGRRAPLVYAPGRPPVLAARVQELFGWSDTPRLARGRVPVLLHVLGPHHRPVQITDDLRGFWTNTYQQVRKDLRGRYPKHAWPDDPLHAPPERKTRAPRK